MDAYHNLLETVLKYGKDRLDRTGVGTKSIFGMQSRYDLRKSFPAVTTKKLHFKPVVGELLWFIRGSTNVEELREITWGKGSTKKTVWDDNYNHQARSLGYENGELGPVYGHQWRNFGSVDQLRSAYDTILNDPYSRRNIVSAWNPPEIPSMALPPCHTMFQFYVDGDELSLQLYQRSADLFLGGPFNIASYSLLVYLMARVTGLKPGDFVWSIGDAHLYSNHIEQVKEQLSRTAFAEPTLKINERIQTFEDLLTTEVSDIELLDYQCHPGITAAMAI